jgi:uncharacterized protein (TIGR04255 family)
MFQVGNAPTPHRFWLLSENESLLIQIQNDRLLLNWRKVKDDDPYPRYGQLRQGFSDLWSDFVGYVTSADYGVFQPSLAEVTFFPRMPVSSASEVPGTIAALNPAWSLDGHLVTSLQIERAILDNAGEQSGKQNIALGYRPEFGLIQLEITSFYRIATESTDSAILDALDQAHDAGVLTFDQITTDGAHTAWGEHDVSTN